jgi:peroxiredoxin
MGNRSWRYVMYVDDGEIIREWSEGGKTHNSPVDPYEETNAFEVYKDLCDDFGIEREDLIEEH